MSKYEFGGEINGPNIFGDGGTLIVLKGADLDRARRDAASLVRTLREADSQRAAEAEELQGELERVPEQGGALDATRVQGWLSTIRTGTTAVTGVLPLIDSLQRLFGHGS
ncbi:hypothetical protein ABZ372_32985 [Streptomyces sp. NPDC005921]|uniref:hypothetical protein n=1 Tax=unclassified Streptomyces TaxID=2593676 RepID=UPI0033FF0AA5